MRAPIWSAASTPVGSGDHASMLSAYTLDQRYDMDAERAFLTGMQALT